MDINPDLCLTVIFDYLQNERIGELLSSQQFDYVVDAIDTLSPKVDLIYHSLQKGCKVISSMGAGGKSDTSMVKVADISKSFNCRLAKMLRKRLTKFGIKKGFTVVFSPEDIPKEAIRLEEGQNKKSSVGTISYMPPFFGCLIASVVINDLMAE
jgi:tRNA A37 threonylcarbamoyladenosine dehydratase